MDSEFPPPVRLRFRRDAAARRLVLACLGFEILLVLIDLLFNYGELIGTGAVRRLCNIAREDGLASWFQASQTLMAGLTLLGIFLLGRISGAPGRKNLRWLLLAFFFVFMSADDGAQIHERLGSTLEDLLPLETAFPSYSWQLFLLPFFAAAGVLMAGFLWRESDDRRLRSALVLALGCFACAVVLDFFEGMEETHRWNLYGRIADALRAPYVSVSHFGRALEEFLEMAGMTLLWGIFVFHLGRAGKDGVLISVFPGE